MVAERMSALCFQHSAPRIKNVLICHHKEQSHKIAGHSFIMIVTAPTIRTNPNRVAVQLGMLSSVSDFRLNLIMTEAPHLDSFGVSI